MPGYAPKLEFHRSRRDRKPARKAVALVQTLIAASIFVSSFSIPARGQQIHSSDTPVVVQPGAPGKPSKTLPSSTRATLLQPSQADVEFMQGMIMHHAQAIEMTALISSHTENKDLRSLGARISSSQSDEIKFMKRWLATRRRTDFNADARHTRSENAGHGPAHGSSGALDGPYAWNADA